MVVGKELVNFKRTIFEADSRTRQRSILKKTKRIIGPFPLLMSTHPFRQARRD